MAPVSAILASIPSPPNGVFHVGPLTIHMYGVMLLLAIAACIRLTGVRWVRWGGDWDLVYRVAIWGVIAGIIGGLLLLWLGLLTYLWRAARTNPDQASLRQALRLLPDLFRLLRRLPADPGLPRGVRIRLGLLLAYLLTPIDLVPDFIPVIGYADDAIIVAIALRSVTRRAGPAALDRHWPGTPAGLATLRRLAGLPTA